MKLNDKIEQENPLKPSTKNIDCCFRYDTNNVGYIPLFQLLAYVSTYSENDRKAILKESVSLLNSDKTGKKTFNYLCNFISSGVNIVRDRKTPILSSMIALQKALGVHTRNDIIYGNFFHAEIIPSLSNLELKNLNILYTAVVKQEHVNFVLISYLDKKVIPDEFIELWFDPKIFNDEKYINVRKAFVELATPLKETAILIKKATSFNLLFTEYELPSFSTLKDKEEWIEKVKIKLNQTFTPLPQCCMCESDAVPGRVTIEDELLCNDHGIICASNAELYRNNDLRIRKPANSNRYWLINDCVLDVCGRIMLKKECILLETGHYLDRKFDNFITTTTGKRYYTNDIYFHFVNCGNHYYDINSPLIEYDYKKTAYKLKNVTEQVNN